ncbi:MAG TPA: hypothetical protein VE476_01965 [Propionibacteriaceae bacterium]|jgi:hypothetical protein|nr:hypothetical protein [Propionibacteriaceae bacterium]
MTSRRRARPEVLGPALVSHVVLTALVWRDISRRDPSELRGSKNLWRVITALNTGNHLLYWLVGRRRRVG